MIELAELLIDEMGCIRIPPDIQDRLGLEPGTSLILEESDSGEIRLRTKDSMPLLVDKDGILVIKAEPLAEFSDIVRHDRESRIASLMEHSKR
jgi:bifunctional DNA-binding transcriptional regulator/antitoxin component of YhaV-PrlF toxin-antitoxin module